MRTKLQELLIEINILHFKRWSRKPYAVFTSIKKVVNISFLTGAVTILSAPYKVNAQPDTIKINKHLEIDEVVVSSNRTPVVYSDVSRIVEVIPHEEIEQSPSATINDILRSVASVDLRKRGAMDIQSDISIRGGSFEQTLILLNGIPLNDPQTGHHNMNLPVSTDAIERIEILSGPASRVYGPNAFTGAVNIITNSSKQSNIRADASAGQYGTYGGNVSVNIGRNNFYNYIATGVSSSDGYRENTDYLQNRFYYSGLLNTKQGGTFHWQAGYLNKKFGANSFYTQKYPDQYEQIKNIITSVGYKKHVDAISVSADIYYRQNRDRFELFREDEYLYSNDGFFIGDGGDTAKYIPGVYESWNYYKGHNYHKTDVWGVKTNVSYTSKIGVSSVGADYRYEHIYSNVLGKELTSPIPVKGESRGDYTKGAFRDYINMYMEHRYSHNKFTISAGALLHYNSDYGTFVAGGGEAGLWIMQNTKMYMSVNQGIRTPTFTDLYYNGPSNIGNPDLQPEKSVEYEFGFKGNIKQLKWNAGLFLRETKDAIDWVKGVDDARYTTTNYTRLHTKGVEFSTELHSKYSGWYNYIVAGATFLSINKDDNQELISAYALDYLKYKFTLQSDHTLYKTLGISWNMAYMSREGSYTNSELEEVDYEPFVVVDMKLYNRWKNITAYCSMSNVFNKQYSDLGGIIQSGRWVIAGIKVDFGLK